MPQNIGPVTPSENIQPAQEPNKLGESAQGETPRSSLNAMQNALSAQGPKGMTVLDYFRQSMLSMFLRSSQRAAQRALQAIKEQRRIG